ncbi:ABC transporter ATP-binding protein [Hathewaya massiliensis]|uniref:ABC transporter ATP-binding protein n=1 Tax=Hathewaya massiliensis TaxID=1964382 RepID=UPI00115A8719|nr:ABC transporter ATP-binding protein [Hathewaya massiliensis]
MLNIEVKNLKKSYGANEVLKGINFKAAQGEIIAIIGKNGAGKSTFLESIMMLKKFDSGEIRIFGKNINSLSQSDKDQIKKDISVVLQPTYFFKNLRVYELLELFAVYYGKNIDIDAVMKSFELESHKKSFFDKLSGGWKQKVALAIAFMTEPKIVVLDEPTTGLDPYMRDVLWKNIIKYNKETKGTVLLSTHNMEEVEEYCDKVMLINNGIVEEFRKPEEILSDGKYKSINQFYLSRVAQ